MEIVYICGRKYFFISKMETIVCESKSFREQVENLCLLFRFLQKKDSLEGLSSYI